MGNPNRRAATPAKPKPDPKNTNPAKKPLPRPGANGEPLCPGHCGVRNRHEEDKTWTVTSPDLPTIVRQKQEGLKEAVTDQRFRAAEHIRGWLELFYSWHGPYDDSAMKQLAKIPPPPNFKPCEVETCPVRTAHHNTIFQPHDKSLPSTIVINTKSLNDAKSNGDYERAMTSRRILVDFWNVHGPKDGSGHMSIPGMPIV
ncbi:MAG: hypothetical protein Q9168_005569 [Polycauliona sp. 1 TL-2023]